MDIREFAKAKFWSASVVVSTSAFQAEGAGSNPTWCSKWDDSSDGSSNGLKIHVSLVRFQLVPIFGRFAKWQGGIHQLHYFFFKLL